MKRLLLTILALVAMTAGVQQVKAQEAYAVYTDDNTTLTFYYDNQRSSRPGETYDLNTGENKPGWRTDVTKVVFDPSFANARPTTTYCWFNAMSELQSITGMSYLNTSEVINMYGMFRWCAKLTSLDLSNFNTAKVTDMWGMFWDCRSLTSLDLSNFNTENVTEMHYMFSNCYSLTSLDLSNFNTSKSRSLWCMFENCYSLTSLDLSSFNTSGVLGMFALFRKCVNLRTIYVGEGWSTAAVAADNSYGRDLFKNCPNLVGGQGTTYDANHVDKDYAHIDGGTSNPGYFTAGDVHYYDLWIAGTQASALNKNDILGDGCASYDPSTKTLTLKGGTIQAMSGSISLGSGIYSEVDGLTIDVQGNTEVVGASTYYGIFLGGTTTITGNAKASVSGRDGLFSAKDTLTIGGNVELEVTGDRFGMYGAMDLRPVTYYSTLTIKDNAKVSARGNAGASLGRWKEIILADGFSVTAPEGASVGTHFVVDAGGSDSVIGGEWVVIERTTRIRGDVNLDGVVDIADVTAVLTAMANGSHDPQYRVNDDEAVDIADVTAILTIMAGQ